jgi:hypothetical protein
LSCWPEACSYRFKSFIKLHHSWELALQKSKLSSAKKK